MKTVCKKLLSLMLVAILLVSAVPFQASAAESDEGPVEGVTQYTLTLYAWGAGDEYQGATVSGGKSVNMTVTYQTNIGVLPDAVLEGYTFAGWYTAAGDKVESTNATYREAGDLTLYARFTLNTKNLELKYTLNGDTANPVYIKSLNLAESVNLLDYLDQNEFNNVKAVVPAGYSWDTHWRDYRLQELTAQDTVMSVAQVVYVNFTANTYKLSFNPQGGTVSPTSKDVTFNTKVGELPTPTYSGKVFLGWADASGKTYTENTVYTVAGDTTLYAQWADEAFVLLKIYINGDTSSADRIMDMTGYIKEQNLHRSDVAAVVKKFYSAADSNGLKLDGLYTDTTWVDYKADSSYVGTETVRVVEGEPMYVYVMVNNAKYGSTSSETTNNTTNNNTSNTTNNNTSTADPSNPATGDMIFVPMAVMVISAAAIVLFLSSKKRMVK